MKNLFLFFVVGWFASYCAADTINEPFNNASIPTDWTQYIGANASAGNTGFSYPGEYLSVSLFRADGNDSAAYVKTSLGDDAIPTYTEDPTPWNEMPEIWMSVDIKWISGTNSTDPTGMVGLFNDDGDNDRSPGFNFMGACFFKGYSTAQPLQVYLRANRGDGQYSPNKTVTGTVLTTTGAVGDTYRISMHFYQGETDYLGDITITDLTNPAIPVLSQTGLVIISGTSWYFERGLDSFGVHNGLSAVKTPNTYGLDNMYYSTTGPISCTNSTGDFTDDCVVNFKDLAVVSEEWLDCAVVPSRLCY